MNIKEEWAICYRIARIKSNVVRPVMFGINFKSSLIGIAESCLLVRKWESFTMEERLNAYSLSKSIGGIFKRLTFLAF